ncbi:MAG: hypothetical protein H6585_04810 [Flavobacteriales bacterium]|nr:hypothetical protein [Flavobacteriales bacterium]MCB9447649.1 hypothetical protein [Flavobacteriales bacterium]
MPRSLTILFTFLSLSAFAQSDDCTCFAGIGSREEDTPLLTVGLDNGVILAVCGFEQKGLSEEEIMVSEFDVFNCATGASLAQYGIARTCMLKNEKGGLTISELRFLPVGEKWEWKQVVVGNQRIYAKGDQVQVAPKTPAYEPTEMDTARTGPYLKEMRGLKGTGKLYPGSIEEILGRLEVMALNNVKEATDMLYDFEHYFQVELSGAIRDQWMDAVETVKWATGN